jgi:hypothetical protein
VLSNFELAFSISVKSLPKIAGYFAGIENAD